MPQPLGRGPHSRLAAPSGRLASRVSRRTLLAGSALTALGAATGCSNSGRLRRRLVEQLTAAGVAHPSWLSQARTEVDEIPTTLFSRWQVVQATNRAEPTPRRLVAAFPVAGTGATLLTGHPDHWADVVIAAGARIDVPASAVESARMMILTTDDLAGRQTLISSIDDMPWIDRGSVDVTAVREEFGHEIGPPRAERDGRRWIATVWTTREQDLIRHSVGIEPDLLHADVAQVWVSGLPLQGEG